MTSKPVYSSRVIDAYEALEEEDKNYLRKFANWWMTSITGSLRDVDGEDLHNEAFRRVLSAEQEPESSKCRPWDGVEDFMVYMIRTIKSVDRNWHKRKKMSELDGQKEPEDESNAERERQIREIIEKVVEEFKGTPDMAVLELLLSDCPPQEIRQRLSLSVKDYDAARKRIQRAIEKYKG